MKSKWIIDIKGLEGFRFGEDKKLYRLPYVKGKRSYSVREIKIQKSKRWVLNNVFYSQRQIKGKIIKDPNPVILFNHSCDCPF